MDACPISFNTSHPLLPRFIPASSAWTYSDPALDVVLTLADVMGQTTEPLPSDFVLDVDGTEKTPISITWDSATELSIQYDEVTLGPTVVRCRYSAKNPDFLSVTGELVTPFDILVSAP